MGDVKERVGGILTTLMAGWFCFVAGSLLTDRGAPRQVASNAGFHLPTKEPARGVSEGKLPYCIVLYKQQGFWKWRVCKHDPEERMLGAGATESYALSRDVAVTLVNEDKKTCQGPRATR